MHDVFADISASYCYKIASGQCAGSSGGSGLGLALLLRVGGHAAAVAQWTRPTGATLVDPSAGQSWLVVAGGVKL